MSRPSVMPKTPGYEAAGCATLGCAGVLAVSGVVVPLTVRHGVGEAAFIVAVAVWLGSSS
jgi:hypothetical protein